MSPKPSSPHLSRWRWLVIAVLMIAVPPLAFYGWFESRSRAIVAERDLDPSFRNALKHASAAAGLYTLLRTVGLSERVAEAGVLELGFLNEGAELVFKRGRRDTTAEIMKDLHNNMVGIATARWMESSDGGGDVDLWSLLANLGDAGALKSTPEALGPLALPAAALADADFRFAKTWFEARRSAISSEVDRSLDAAKRATGGDDGG